MHVQCHVRPLNNVPVKINALKYTFKIQETIYIKTCMKQRIPNMCYAAYKKELKTR